MLLDNLTLTGQPSIILRDSDGNIKTQFTINNTVVTAGKTYFAARAVGTQTSVMQHMAVGTNTTPSAVANTALGAEISRAALSAATASINQVTYTATFGSGAGAGAISEIGIFNAGTNGIMLCRAVFPVVNKAADDRLDISWVISVN